MGNGNSRPNRKASQEPGRQTCAVSGRSSRQAREISRSVPECRRKRVADVIYVLRLHNDGKIGPAASKGKLKKCPMQSCSIFLSAHHFATENLEAGLGTSSGDPASMKFRSSIPPCDAAIIRAKNSAPLKRGHPIMNTVTPSMGHGKNVRAASRVSSRLIGQPGASSP